MANDSPSQDRQAKDDRRQPKPRSCWVQRYGAKHRWHRLTDFAAGLQPPVKVRIYHRTNHFILQWWDPGAKRNLAERINGDLLAALIAARQIDERLAQRHTAGTGRSRVLHSELVAKFLDDLALRADAEEIDLATVRRYQAALRHYLAFCEQPTLAKSYPHATNINRDFRLTFVAFLSSRSISPNGHPHTRVRPMKGQAFVEDVVRSLYEWAADPNRGNLLPHGFHNPFRRSGHQRKELAPDLAGEPDITGTMAIEFFSVCDAYQLALFVSLAFFGLRPREVGFLFREYVSDGWLRVPCNPDLCYRTKGRRDKRFPLLPCIEMLWHAVLGEGRQGLLYLRRGVVEGREQAPLLGVSLADLIQEFQSRCARQVSSGAAERQRLRDQLLKEAGGLRYDHVEAEFEKLARRLKWPPTSTMKDFRHLFSTCTENAGVPQHYRQYLLGQSPGKLPINVYTHLNKIRDHYEVAIRRELQPLVEVLVRRAQELGVPDMKELTSHPPGLLQ